MGGHGPPLPGTRLTLINPPGPPTAPYSGMLPGHIAGHYSRDALDIDLVKLARFAGARLILGAASAIDPDTRMITVGDRRIAYDLASIDVGIHAQMPDIEGFAEFGTGGAKPLDTYAARWREFLARAKAGEVAPEVAVIGGGVAGGAELSLAMAHALRRDVGEAARICVIEASDRITGKTAGGATRHLDAAMTRLGVAVELNAKVTRLTAEGVELADNRTIPPARFTVGAAGGAFAHPWLADSPPLPPLTRDGFIKVDAYLRVQGRRDLFAVGDCAHLSHAPRPPKAGGVYAVRSGPVLYHNLRAALVGDPPKTYRPQGGDYLKLVSLGGQDAIAEKYGLSFAAPPWVWRWKDRIDRKFMDKFRTLPKMPAPPALPQLITQGVRDALGGKPLCGGCGSKLGPEALSGALSKLPAPTRSDVLSGGPGDDAGVLAFGDTRQVLTTDHLRAFTQDPPALMARIAAVHALGGDIWAMGGAKPQSAMVQVTLPRMSPPALQSRSLTEIMDAAGGDVIRAAGGAEIVGGHSTMGGAELTIGFSLTGLTDRPITKGGGRAGDALILTRPIGAGTILAAEMQGAATGQDVTHLLTMLARPQGDAAEVLAGGAHAMTDVTGFGLAGHLLEICRASHVAAEVTLDAVPLYPPGALDLAEAGHRSTLYPANRDAAPR